MSPLPLVILAGGRGSRFGGPKQLAEVGSCGDILIAYSIYDAVRAGFGPIVIVTREELMNPLDRALAPVIQSLGATLSLVVQPVPSRADLPSWGTAHAVLCACPEFAGPFGVANGDDWYGPTAYRSLAATLSSDDFAHVLVTYPVGNTLANTDRVSRAVCDIRPDGSLAGLEEFREVEISRGRVTGRRGDEAPVEVPRSAMVSTNLWGFRPSICGHLDARFAAFRQGLHDGEFALPTVIHALLRDGSIRVDTTPTAESMCGLTRETDVPRVQARLADLVASGHYPADLRLG